MRRKIGPKKNRFVTVRPAAPSTSAPNGTPGLQEGGFDSIRTRLTGIGLLFILGTSLAMAMVGMRLTNGFVQARSGDNFQLLATYLARNAELGVLLENPQMLESLARNVLALEDVQAVLVTQADGRTLLARQKGATADPDLGRVSALVFAERLDPEIGPDAESFRQEIGRVSLAYSRTGLDRLGQQMAGRFLAIALGLSVGAVLLYWLMARAIVAPLKSLLAVTRQVSHGRLDIRADGGSLPETKALARTFNEMLDALTEQRQRLAEAHSRMARQEALAELGKFSMMVAHEIKNPLAIIKGSLDLLKKDAIDPEMKATVSGYLDEEVARINRLIEDFLLFARPGEPAFAELTLADFLTGLVNRMELARQGDDGALLLSPVDPGLRLWGDPNLLERAIGNILRNAAEAGAERIEIATEARGERLLIRIGDNGPGIAPAAVERLFEPFFSTKAKGSGLGLAMVKEIVEAHGGSIGLQCPSEGGAVFELDFPRWPGKQEMDGAE